MEAAPSRTAMLAAVTRGNYRLSEAQPWILDDPFALMLVGPAWKAMSDRLASLLPERLLRKTNTGNVLRPRLAEDRLTAGEFRQYVLLGAGLDSFAWRRPDLVGRLRVFEVDHPASQAWKRQRAADLGLPEHDSHIFVPVDFEVMSLRAGLEAAGFDWHQPAVFSWIAVTMYLTVDAIEETLRMITSCAAGSEVVFDYALPERFFDDDDREIVALFAPLAASSDEPMQTFFAPHDAEDVITRCGLRVVDHPDRGELLRRYFPGRRDGSAPSGVRLLVATVP